MLYDVRANARSPWKRMWRVWLSALACVCGLMVFAVVANAQSRNGSAATTYEADLGPSPLDGATKPSIAGHGSVSASLDGNKLTISGEFAGMPSAATDAHVQAGDGIGVPGNAIFDLTVTKAPDGTLAGNYTLTASQVAQFKKGYFYIQINSEKMGAPFGTLWGWLLPPHPKIEADVPDEGSWYMPPHGPSLHD